MSLAPPIDLPRLLRLAVLVIGLGAGLGARAATAAGPAEAAPELRLPGGWIAMPGRTIELTWGAADSVRELEILMSTDGGRHYAVAVSPQLDPRAHRFRWRVPARVGASVQLRIRYNRGGREIEGPPTAALRTQGGNAPGPEPLGLPPLAAGETGGAERAPARSAAPVRANAGLSVDGRELHDRTPLADAGRPAHASARHMLRPLTVSSLVVAGRVPAFVPLRA